MDLSLWEPGYNVRRVSLNSCVHEAWLPKFRGRSLGMWLDHDGSDFIKVLNYYRVIIWWHDNYGWWWKLGGRIIVSILNHLNVTWSDISCAWPFSVSPVSDYHETSMFLPPCPSTVKFQPHLRAQQLSQWIKNWILWILSQNKLSLLK